MMFGQPTLRAKWKKECGWRPEDARGLAVEEHVARLRDKLLPLAERFYQLGNKATEGLRRQRQMPSPEVERSVPLVVRLVPTSHGKRQAIEQVADASLGMLSKLPENEPIY